MGRPETVAKEPRGADAGAASGAEVALFIFFPF
jgi:hypothetical protein